MQARSIALPASSGTHGLKGASGKLEARGKFFFSGAEKVFLKGVTYGPFGPDGFGTQFPDRETVKGDLPLMVDLGANTFRTFTVPPRWLLDLAVERDLRVLAGVPWAEHVCFLDSKALTRSIRRAVAEAVTTCADHPALAAYLVGNEIPPDIVRWYGAPRVAGFLRELVDVVRGIDPGSLVGYANFPSTEYLETDFTDFLVVQQAMSTMRVIQAFTREEDEHGRFMTASRRSLAAGLQLYTLQTLYSCVVNVVIAVGTAAVVWVGARHVLDGSLSVGSLVIFVSYLASLYGPINSMFQTYGLAQASRAGVQRVFELLDVEREIVDGRRDAPAKGARGHVVWEDVVFEYTRGHPVLNGVSLHVQPGQKVAIVGPTGAGKSTLLSLIPRFYDPAAGRVLVDGLDAREYRLASLRRQIAMVLQPPLVFPTSLRENIAFGRPGARPDEVAAAARLACLDDMIKRLPRGYDTLVGEQGVTLSEGEKQRITIARAILRDSPILILDEPTSALDSETEALLMQGLERLTAGRTTFIIAHRLSTARRADLIVVLRDGRIVEQGRFETLIEGAGAFASLYRLQGGFQEEGRLAVP